MILILENKYILCWYIAYTQTLGPNCCLNSSMTDISSEPTATKNLIHLSQSKSISRKHFFYVTPIMI